MTRDVASAVLGELMLAGGWAADDEEAFASGPAFSRVAHEGFAETARFSLYEVPLGPVVDSLRDFVNVVGRGAATVVARVGTVGRWPKRPSLRVDGLVGVECLPATSVLRAIAADPTVRVSVTDYAAELAQPERPPRVTIENATAMRGQLAALVGEIDERARAFAEQHATMDAFLAMLRSDGPSRPLEDEVSLLIALDRRAEARELLASSDENASLEQRRFARQATRLLDGEVSLEQLAQALPDKSTPRPRLGPLLRGTRKRIRDARDAVDAVRRSTAAGSRDERRVLLKAQLAERDLTETPMWIESRLDELEPGYEKPSTAGTVRAIRALPGAIRGAISAHDREAIDPPWLIRPPKACYEIGPPSSRRAGVELDADVESWLDEAFAAAARRFELDPLDFGYVELDLWFTAAPDTGTDPRIIAWIGEQRVGLVDPNATHALNAILTTAALRAELPWTVGRLNRRKHAPRYVLEFSEPTGSQTPRNE